MKIYYFLELYHGVTLKKILLKFFKLCRKLSVCGTSFNFFLNGVKTELIIVPIPISMVPQYFPTIDSCYFTFPWHP